MAPSTKLLPSAALLLCMGLAPGALAQALPAVYPAHPRLWIRDTASPDGRVPGLAELRARCGDPAFASLCQEFRTRPPGGFPGSPGAMPGIAFRYAVWGDTGAAQEAMGRMQLGGPSGGDRHSATIDNTTRLREIALAYDWLYGYPGFSNRDAAEDTMVSLADWLMGIEPDVFHNDTAPAAGAVGMAGLALMGGRRDADGQRLLGWALDRFRTVIFPAHAYLRGYWPEGWLYFNFTSLRWFLWFTSAYRSAVDGGLYAEIAERHNDFMRGYLYFYMYFTRPDLALQKFGDTNQDLVQLDYYVRPNVDMILAGVDDPRARFYAQRIGRERGPGYYSWATYQLLIFGQPSAPSTDYADLPPSRLFSPGAADVAILRSGWGAGDTFVSMRAGDFFSEHQDIGTGALTVFRYAPLLAHTGNYTLFGSAHHYGWANSHSVHANTLFALAPGEQFPTYWGFPNANDGGQRVMQWHPRLGTTPRNKTLQAWKDFRADGSSFHYFETGDVKAFETQAAFDYVAADITAAYNSTLYAVPPNIGKVSEVTRQLVFLKPEVIVVFDRVETTDPSFLAGFRMHALADPVQRGEELVVTNGPGRLFARVLLPVKRDISVHCGPDAFSYDGQSFALDGQNSEGGRCRIDVTASESQRRHSFLHVLQATSSSTEQMVPLAPTDGTPGVELSFPEGTRARVTFGESGPLGGHIQLVDGSGQTLVDRPLSDRVQTPGDPSPDNASPAGPGPTALSACRCSSPAGDAEPLFLFALGLLALGRTRRPQTLFPA